MSRAPSFARMRRLPADSAAVRRGRRRAKKLETFKPWRPLQFKSIHGRGLAALERAEKLGAGQRGSYTLQAAIAGCHARALNQAQFRSKR